MVSVKEGKSKGVSIRVKVEYGQSEKQIRSGMLGWEDSLVSFLVQTICFFNLIQHIPFEGCFDKM